MCVYVCVGVRVCEYIYIYINIPDCLLDFALLFNCIFFGQPKIA